MRRTPSRILTLVAVVALVLAGCGGDAADDLTPTTTAPATTTTEDVTTTTAAPQTTTTSAPSTTTTTPATTTTTEDAGEPVDFGPVAGDVLGVVGVAHDDVLNVRSGPGVNYEVVVELDPTEDDVVAKGNTWSLDDALWIEVEAGGVEGWVNLRYVGYLGETDDTTSQIVETLGETPEVETMLDLGTLVAETVAEGAGEGVDIVMSVAPTVGDLGEVTFDVLGFEDDSVRGARLHVFGTPSESGEGFILKSVESTSICSRGVSDGLCA